MKLSGIYYLISQGFKSLWHNRLLSFTSMGVLTTGLVIVGVALLITVNINNIVSYMESQNEFVVFLDDLNDEEISKVSSSIRNNINVADSDFISKKEALENQKNMLGKSGALLDGLEDQNPLPDTFIVKVKNIKSLDETVKQISEINGVIQINAATEVANTLRNIKNLINTFGLALIIALSVISLVIITNTIKATIFTRRKEINIMKYVGATNLFIRIPFVVEGMVLGLVSAFIAYFCISIGYNWFVDVFTLQASAWIQSAFENILPFESFKTQLIVFFVVIGLTFGVSGSLISIRKHAKV